MPEGSGKIAPLFRAVLAGRVDEKGVHARIGHIKERKEIVLACDLLFGKEVHLRVGVSNWVRMLSIGEYFRRFVLLSKVSSAIYLESTGSN